MTNKKYNNISALHLLEIFNNIEDVVIIINPDHTIHEINKNGKKLLKKNKNEIIGKKCHEVICRNNNIPSYCPIKNKKTNSADTIIEKYFENFDKYFSLKASPVTDRNGNIIQYVDIMRNIDALKRSEIAVKEKNEEIETQNEEIRAQNEELKEKKEEIVAQNEELRAGYEEMNKAAYQLKDKEERLNNAEAIAGMGSWEYKTKTNSLWCSKNFYKLIGCKPKNFIHNIKSLISLAHPDDIKKVTQKINNALQNHSPYKIEHRIINYNKKTMHVLSQGKVIYDKDEHEYKVSGIILDITKRKQTKLQIQDSERKLKEAQKLAKIGNWELDLQNNKLYWSNEIHTIFEVKSQLTPVTYEAFLEKVHPEDREKVNNAYARSLKDKKPYDIVHRLLLDNGKVKYVREKCKTEYNEYHKPIRSTGVIIDITESKLAEQQMEKALEKEKELSILRSQFVSTVTHEFRTPLASIHSNIQLLQRYSEKWNEEKKQQSFKRVYEAIKSLSSLLEDVSILGKEQSGRMQFNPEPTDISNFLYSLAEEANEAYKEKPSIIINSLFPVKTISIDQALLRLILINLFTNALKYSSAEDPQPELSVNKGKEKNKIHISIKDYGKGIPYDDLKNIFQPFFRGSNVENIKGTGLGMSIVQKSVKLHNGSIDIKSEKNKGTTVTIILSFFDASRRFKL